MEKGDVLKIISNHLFNHVVKMPFTNLNSGTNSNSSNLKTGKNGNCYTQVKGIPQGIDISYSYYYSCYYYYYKGQYCHLIFVIYTMVMLRE